MGWHRPYKPRSNAVGLALLMLRYRTKLTQIELATLVGVSKRSVLNWESGESYPKEGHLRQLIALFAAEGAFMPGAELAEAEQLWQQASQDGSHPLAAFDAAWFARLLAERSSTPAPAPATPLAPNLPATPSGEQRSTLAPSSALLDRRHSVVDWGEAIDVPTLYGRESELGTLQQWVVEEHCRVVAILGLGGMGKSSLAITLAHQALAQFDVVLFRSLRNGPPLAQVLDQTIGAVSDQQAIPPEQLGDKITRLVELLRERRCLLILDNVEAIMQPGAPSGTYRSGYVEYGELLRALSEREHQSCLLLTSREKPAELGPLEGRSAPVRTLPLTGLDDRACHRILEARNITGTPTTVSTLSRLYGGNPLALLLISEPIHELFGGDVAAFLAMGDAFFNGVGKLLAQQFGRSTPLEQAILYWLAIARELAPLSDLRANLGEAVPQREVLVALESLRHRMLIERAAEKPTFTLQPVILEFLTDQLVEAIHHELVDGQPQLLRSHALVQATAKEYVRRSQEQLIARPLLERLAGASGDAEGLEKRLLEQLASWREQPRSEHGYGPGNVVNLLRLLRGHLRGLDLTRLAIRQAYLAEVDAQDARLVEAELADTVLAEAFHFSGPVALSGDGALLAAGTSTGQVGLWRVADRLPLWAVQGHTGGVWSVALSADSQLVASGGGDGTVRLWETGTGRPVATLQSHTGGIWLVALSADGQLLAGSSFDGTVKLWEASSRRLLATLQSHTGAIRGVALSTDGVLAASGGEDGTVRLWEASSGRLLATLQGHSGVVWSVALSADSQLLASGSLDGTVKLWEASSGRLLATLSGHTGVVWSVALSADGRLLASGGGDGMVKLWEASSGRPLATLSGHTSAIRVVALSADGVLVASGSYDGMVRLWEASSGRPLASLSGHTGAIRVVALSADGVLVASGGGDGMVRLWEARCGRLLATLQGHNGAVGGVALSSDGQLVASGSYDGMVRLWEARSGRLLATLQGHTGAIRGVALAGDGRLVASGGEDGTVKLWEASSGRLLATLQGHTSAVWGVALSADGVLLASGSLDGTVRLWEARSGRLLATLQGHTSAVWCVALSADGVLVASGSLDGTVRLWEASSGRPVATLSGHTGAIRGVALSSDGHLVASGGEDATVRLWEASSGRLLATLQGHNGVVADVALSGDGRLVASGSLDGTVRLWEATSGTCLRTIRPERRYERMNISGLIGISEAQRASLIGLGAVERPVDRAPAPATTPDSAVADQPTPGDQQVASRLPSLSTSFVGRDDDLAAIARLLADPACRLLTLLGPGGVGKTRLALEVAAHQGRAFADGVAFVALASVSTPNQIVSTIGDTLSLSFTGHSDPTADLLDYLRERHMLLMLDNFEHLLAGADLLSAMLERAPHLTLLLTSRERLNLQAEWLFDVDGLALPPEDPRGSVAPQSLGDVADYSAIQLFVQRAIQVQPRLSLSEENLTTIVRICQHVAGMPLAIELAAAGVRALPLADIELQLGANLDVLATSLRDVTARHRSMRAAFDHSWDLLSEEERTLFSRLAVFRGGWTIEAAVHVAGATLAVLTTLVDKSLARREMRSSADRIISNAVTKPRFDMLEPIREYALERLVSRGEVESLRHAHASYYLALASEAAAQWYTATIDSWIATLHRESDNMHAALQWARNSGDGMLGLQLAGALWKFWQGYGYTSEGRVWLDQLLTLDDPNPDPANMVARLSGLQAAAWLASDQHDDAQTTRLLEESMLLRRALRETKSQTNPLVNAARQARTEGQYRRATAALEEALSRYSELRARLRQGNVDLGLELYDLGQVLRVSGVVCREQGDFAQARSLFEESLTMYRKFGEREGVAFSLVGLADVARDQGDTARVREYGAESVSILRELRIQWMLGFALNDLAQAAYIDGELAQALALIDESVTLFRELKAYSSLTEVLITQGHIQRAQGHTAAAYSALSEALRFAWAVGPRLFVAASLEGLATLEIARGEAQRAISRVAAASMLRVRMNTPVRPVDQATVEQTLATARSMLGENAFAAVWTEAQSLPVEQILNGLPGVAAFTAVRDRSET